MKRSVQISLLIMPLALIASSLLTGCAKVDPPGASTESSSPKNNSGGSPAELKYHYDELSDSCLDSSGKAGHNDGMVECGSVSSRFLVNRTPV